jgi:hypothetical protein
MCRRLCLRIITLYLYPTVKIVCNVQFYSSRGGLFVIPYFNELKLCLHKTREPEAHGMLATTQFRIFHLSICSQQIYKSVILPVVLCMCKLGQKRRVR